MGSLRASLEGAGTDFLLTTAMCVAAGASLRANTAAPISAVTAARCRKRVMLWSERATYVGFQDQMMFVQRRHHSFRFELPADRIHRDGLGRADDALMCVHRELLGRQVSHLIGTRKQAIHMHITGQVDFASLSRQLTLISAALPGLPVGVPKGHLNLLKLHAVSWMLTNHVGV